MQSNLFKYLFSYYLRRTVLHVWGEKQENVLFAAQDIQRIIDTTWRFYYRNSGHFSKPSNLGNWLVFNFAILTLSVYEALKDFGIRETTAITLIQDLTWHITSIWTRRTKHLSSYFFRDSFTQLDFFVALVMKTLFSPPDYRFKKGNLENGFFLNVFQCPVAEMLKTRGLSELCEQSWCSVDFGLVEIFGAELKRTGTLAMGKQVCDFKFFAS